MEFLDCNLTYGPDTEKGAFSEGTMIGRYPGCTDVGGLQKELGRAGVSGGLVYYAMQEPIQGNAELPRALAGCPGLYGVWSLLPPGTGEVPPPADLPAAMKQGGIAALTLSPHIHRYPPRARVIGGYLEMAQERSIPVLLNTGRGLSLDEAYDIMLEFRELTAVLTYNNGWPNDRLLRPFLDAFPNLYLDMAHIQTAAWLADIVKAYTARRIMFGSGFPWSYMGAHMMVIKHAPICDSGKALIAGGNLRGVLEGARYD